jgi:hypothetical protein
VPLEYSGFLLSFQYYDALNIVAMQLSLDGTVMKNCTAMNNDFNNFWYPRFNLVLV